MHVRQFLQVVEGKNSAGMAIAPRRLQAVAAYQRETPPLKSRRGQRFVGPFVKLPQDIHLALAARARTSAAQGFQNQITLTAIVPLDGQFTADGLYVCRSHTASLV